MVLLALASALFALGVGCITYVGLGVPRRRAARRRIAALTSGTPQLANGGLTVGARVRLRARSVLLYVRARPGAGRTVAIVLALGGVVFGLATGTAIAFGLVIVAAALARVSSEQARIHGRISNQMVGSVQLLAAGLRAGYSVPQAITLAARDSPEPTAAEFTRTAREMDLGGGTQAALTHLAERVANEDYALMAFIVGVQQQVGGNLARTLDSVAETLRERVELRQQVAALTAQQRMSAIVLTSLPGAIMLLLFVVDPAFVGPMFGSGLGRFLLGIAGALIATGWFVMRSFAQVEV